MGSTTLLRLFDGSTSRVTVTNFWNAFDDFSSLLADDTTRGPMSLLSDTSSASLMVYTTSCSFPCASALDFLRDPPNFLPDVCNFVPFSWFKET